MTGARESEAVRAHSGKAGPLSRSSRTRIVSLLALVAADIVAWIAALLVVSVIPVVFWRTFPVFWTLYVAGLGWILFRFASRLYPPGGISQPKELRRSFQTTMAAAFIHLAMLIAIAAHNGLAIASNDSWRVAGLGVWLILVPIAYFCRSVTKAILIRRRLFGDPYVVIGTGEKGRRTLREMRANPELGQVPVAAFGDQPELWGSMLEGVPVLGPIEEAKDRFFSYPVRHAMVALSSQEADTTRIDQIAGELSPRGPSRDWGCGGQLGILAFVLWPRVDAWLRC